jgi:serine protease Do
MNFRSCWLIFTLIGIFLTSFSQQKSSQDLIATKADYTKLEQLLAAGKWKEADGETTNKMLEVTGREKEGWLTYEDVENFSCPDLRAMDRVWVKYSDGRFGFSVQKRIYQSLGGRLGHPKPPHPKEWAAYGEAIGWKQRGEKGEWLSYSQLTFNTNAPSAHLPVPPGKADKDEEVWNVGGPRERKDKRGWERSWELLHFMQRLVKCNL